MDPNAIRESRRQEEFQALGGAEGVADLPGVKAHREAREQERRERQEAERLKLQAHQERQRQRAEVEQEELRRQLEQRWIVGGGDKEGFETAWPSLRDRVLQERALGAAARVDYRSSVVNF
jgi:hypothetical protein